MTPVITMISSYLSKIVPRKASVQDEKPKSIVLTEHSGTWHDTDQLVKQECPYVMSVSDSRFTAPFSNDLDSESLANYLFPSPWLSLMQASTLMEPIPCGNTSSPVEFGADMDMQGDHWVGRISCTTGRNDSRRCSVIPLLTSVGGL